MARHPHIVRCELCDKELKTTNTTADHHFCTPCWMNRRHKAGIQRIKLGIALKAMQTGHASKQYTPPTTKLTPENVMR